MSKNFNYVILHHFSHRIKKTKTTSFFIINNYKISATEILHIKKGGTAR